MRRFIEGFLILIIGLAIYFFWGQIELFSAHTPLYWGIAQEGNTFSTDQLLKKEMQIDIPITYLEFFQTWPNNPTQKPPTALLESLNEIWSFGAVPILTWEPMFFSNDEQIAIPYKKILLGDYDPYLKNIANIVKKYNNPLLIRFAHEMNLSHYHWGTTKDEYGPNSPQIYKKMFQYVVDFFKQEEVNNVLWVFCPNHYSIPNPIETPSASWNHVIHYYPGDNYVDILGMDGYNWGESMKKEKDGWTSHWQSFEEIFSLLHNELNNLFADKPIMIFETACSPIGGDKARWVKDAIIQAKKWNLQGLIWFQINKEQKWSLSKKDLSEVDTNFPKRPSSQLWVEELLHEKTNIDR